MKASILRSGVAALALGGIIAGATALPARADTTTTKNILYGAAAAAAAFTLYNVEHKQQLAHTVQGHLSDGSTVYGDGRVVSPNGYSWYPGNNGQTVACSNQYCTVSGGNYGYGYNNGYNGYGYNNNGGYYGSSRGTYNRNANARNRYNRNGYNRNGSDRDGDDRRGH